MPEVIGRLVAELRWTPESPLYFVILAVTVFFLLSLRGFHLQDVTSAFAALAPGRAS